MSRVSGVLDEVVTDHGADVTLPNNAPAIQAAIDAVAARGGGRVIVPAGTFATGSIVLRDHVELHLAPGAVLDGVADLAAYTDTVLVTALSSGEVNQNSEATPVLIGAQDAVDVAITGPGEVRGAGHHFVAEAGDHIHRCPQQRPFTVFLRGCRRVRIEQTLFTDAALWCIRLTGCEGVRISGITIDADLRHPNADGIDIDHCRQVRISDCDISCGDDAISLKTCEEFAQYGPTEDVVVTNCVLRSTSSAVVVGVDAVDDIRRVTVSNCVVRSSHRGLSVNLGQRGSFSDIVFSDCVVETRFFASDWWGHGEPIYVTAFPWHGSGATGEIGMASSIRFHNILCRSENGVLIAGLRPELVRDVVLDGVRVQLDRWSSWPGGGHDLRPHEQGPELRPGPTSAFHVEHATDVVLRNCRVEWAGSDDSFAHAVRALVAPGLVVENLDGSAACPDLPAVAID